MIRRLVLLAVLGALVPAASAQASLTTLLDTTVSSAAEAASCIDGRVAGAATRALTVPGDGYLSVKLVGSAGDWDVAAYDQRGRMVAGSAGFTANELAQGFVRKGQQLTIQACGAEGSARMIATLARIDLEAAEKIKLSLVEVGTPERADVERLATLGLDLTEHSEPGKRSIVASAADLRTLRANGFSYEVAVEDVAADSRRDRAADAQFAASVEQSELPSGSNGYRRLPQIEQDMKDLVTRFPDLVKPLTLELRTLEGRDVHGVEITPDVHTQDGKPVFFMSGVHHAREWPSAENPLEFAFDLAQGYGNDARVTHLLDRARVIIVPVMNTDGFNLSREGGTAAIYEYKRKNCRTYDGVHVPGACALAPEASGNGVGVDPNRNWGGDWGGPGAANDPVTATYRGAGPFSEPEVENLHRLISQRQVTTFITNHTYGSLILRPPGIAAFGLSKDEGLLKDLGDSMAEHNAYTSQYSWQLYDTSGTAEAWSYFATGGLGYTFEIHNGNFHRTYQDAVISEYMGTTSKGGQGGNREAYFTALESTVNEERHGVLVGKAPKGARITISKSFENPTSRVQPPVAALPWGAPRVFTDTLTSTMVVPANGQFEFHVNPSTRPDVFGGRAAEGPTTADMTMAPTATTTRDFTVVPGEDNAGVRVRLDSGAPVDDWSLELQKEVEGDWVRQARSAVGTRSYEEIETHLVGPGNYRLIMTAVRTPAQPAAVSVDFLEPQPPEAYKLTCTPYGAKGVETENAVIVDRGQRVDVGKLCK